MKWPFISRDEHDITVTALLADIDILKKRVKDLERQFVTRYADDGAVAETLAEVPLAERGNIKVIKRPKNPTQGMNWDQRRRWLEATDGGRKVNGQ